MNRKLILYAVLLGLVIGLIVFIDATRPKPVNWKPTYSTKDKIPLGLYIFDQEAPSLFNGAKIEKLKETPYEFFDKLYDYEKKQYKGKGSFLSIGYRHALDEESIKELIYFAEHGNTVFLSMQDFPVSLLDTLDIRVTEGYMITDSLDFYTAKNVAKKYSFKEGIGTAYFDSISDKTEVLGYQKLKEEEHPNLIRVPFGYGSFVLHSQPTAFSNFHLLKGNHSEYAEKVLSTIPEGDIYWQVSRYGNKTSGSPLRYILSQPALKWALWIGLLTLIVFMIFNARRKQRVVPEIPPLRNTSVEFAKTIGNLYYQEGNHHTIIEKQIIYFLEHIRNEYHIDTYSLDSAFMEKLHLKTGKPFEDIQKAVDLIKKHRHEFQSTEADVIAINKAIEKLRT